MATNVETMFSVREKPLSWSEGCLKMQSLTEDDYDEEDENSSEEEYKSRWIDRLFKWNFLDLLLSWMRLNDEEDETSVDEDKKTLFIVKNTEEDTLSLRQSVPKKERIKREKTTGNAAAVCVMNPASVEEVREIIKNLLEDKIVILNLEGMDVDIAQRIIDITSGSCFAVKGRLHEISHCIFIVTTASVVISGDCREGLSGVIQYR